MAAHRWLSLLNFALLLLAAGLTPLVLQLSLVVSDSSYLWDDCVEVSHGGRLGKRPCLA